MIDSASIPSLPQAAHLFYNEKVLAKYQEQ